jgi:hypothetical protein
MNTQTILLHRAHLIVRALRASIVAVKKATPLNAMTPTIDHTTVTTEKTTAFANVENTIAEKTYLFVGLM